MGKKLKENKKTVLIVEDNREILDLLAQGLSREGYITIKAEDGTKAIAIASDIRPDLTILDLNLPDYDGIDILGRLKAMHASAQVVIISGYGSQDAARSAMEAGAFDFLTKPFDIDEVYAVVKEALLSEPPIVYSEES